MPQEIGEQLRQAREAEGLTLEEVEKGTRIRVKFLRAMEAGDLDAMPTPAQVRGFLRNYARYVGLDPAEVIAQLDAALSLQGQSRLALLAKRVPAFRQREATPPARDDGARKPHHRSLVGTVGPQSVQSGSSANRLSLYWRIRRFVTPDVILLGVIVVIIVGGIVWGGMQISSVLLAGTQTALTPEIIGPTATATATATPFANITFTPTQPPALENFTDVQLELVIEQGGTLIIVMVDGDEQFRGMPRAGDRLSFSAQRQIELSTGNAAGVRVILNQTDFGVLGDFGEIVTRIFQPNGMVTPTPTIDPLSAPAATES